MEPVSGRVELAALAQSPADPDRARALAVILTARAQADPDFAHALAAWQREAAAQQTGEGNVSSSISGGHQDNVVVARDISGPMTFGTPPARPTS
ncbi:hypothetical protein ABZ721_10555 [Streptomyces sp. NPDC006733]|uniref:hypothetical protein n=1 Tax=Streptomyces sp. NPDC006733 TaxID=3155460 RepID=UPI0033CE7CBC